MAKIGHQALVSPSFDLFFKILMLQLAINVVLKDLVRQKKSRWEKSMGNDPRTQILGIQLQLEIHILRPLTVCLTATLRRDWMDPVIMLCLGPLRSSRAHFLSHQGPHGLEFRHGTRHHSFCLTKSRPAWTGGTDRNFSTWKIDHRTQKVRSGSWFSYGI